MLEGQNASWFLDLASKEYGQVIHSFIPKDKLHQVDFLEDKGDGKAPRAIQVYLKQARGMLARFALEEAVEHPEELREFEEKGYQFDPSRSTLHKTVFLRHL